MMIRAALCEDSPGLGRVQLDSWHATPGAEIKPPSYWARFSYGQREQAWRQLLASDRPLTALLAAAESGEIVGFAWSTRNSGAYHEYCAELCAIHVLPAHRGCGVGTALLHATAQLVRERACDSLMLWTGKLNRPAQAWYEKLGGLPLGEQSTDLDGVAFVEVGYGWPAIEQLILATAPRHAPAPAEGR